MPLFNPTESDGSAAVPQIVGDDATYEVEDNTQVIITNPIIVTSTGTILVSGTGALVFIN